MLAVSLAAVMSVSLLTGCQKSTPTPEPSKEAPKTTAPVATPAAEKKEQTPLKVLVYGDQWFDQVLKDFESKNPGMKTERKKSEGVDTGVLTALLASNDAPDILLMNSGPARVLPLAKAGLLEDLTDQYQIRKWNDRVSPAVLSILKKFDSKLYEVCNGMDIFQVYYNKKIFEKAGVQAPATYDQLIQAAAKIKKSGVLPIALGARDNFAAGYDFMTSVIYGDGKYTDEKMVKAAKELKRFVDEGIISKDSLALDNIEGRTLFSTGKASMYIGPQGNMIDVLKDGVLKEEDIGVFVMPSMSGGKAIPTSGLAHSWTMNKNSKNKEAALKFLDYVTSDDYIKKLNELNAWMYGAPAIKIGDSVKIPAIIKGATDSVKDGSGFNPSVFQAANVKTAYYAANQAIISGQKTPEDAMKDVQKAKETK